MQSRAPGNRQGIDVASLDKVKDRPVGVLGRSRAEALLRERGFTRIRLQPEMDECVPDAAAPDRRLAGATAAGHLHHARGRRRFSQPVWEGR
jgi:hypothetical protein